MEICRKEIQWTKIIQSIILQIEQWISIEIEVGWSKNLGSIYIKVQHTIIFWI
jgi:hypothetical protein